MIQELEFSKVDDKWYLSSPEYIAQGGSVPDLQMVLGADNLLEELSEGRTHTLILITATESQEVREFEHLPMFAHHNWEYLIRADYVPVFEDAGKYYTGYNQRYIWLCPVTLFVFGSYPKYIYYKIKKNEPKKVQEQEDGPDF